MMTFVKFQEGQDTDLFTPISHSIVPGWVILPDGERVSKSPSLSIRVLIAAQWYQNPSIFTPNDTTIGCYRSILYSVLSGHLSCEPDHIPMFHRTDWCPELPILKAGSRENFKDPCFKYYAELAFWLFMLHQSPGKGQWFNSWEYRFWYIGMLLPCLSSLDNVRRSLGSMVSILGLPITAVVTRYDIQTVCIWSSLYFEDVKWLRSVMLG